MSPSDDARVPAMPLTIEWPPGAELITRRNGDGTPWALEVRIGERLVARVFGRADTYRRSDPVMLGEGYYLTREPDQLGWSVVENKPEFSYHTKMGRFGETVHYEEVRYRSAAWSKGEAWIDVEKRGWPEESNPWRKRHNGTFWRWSRRLRPEEIHVTDVESTSNTADGPSGLLHGSPAVCGEEPTAEQTTLCGAEHQAEGG